MGHACQYKFSRLRTRRSRLYSLGCQVGAAGLCIWGIGCATPSGIAPAQVTARVAVAETTPIAARGTAAEPGTLPTAEVASKTLPISLDSVLRLAGEQNVQVALARERMQEACREQCAAGNGWIPDVRVGASYWRHEGGNQNPDGTFVHSSFGGMFAGADISGTLNLQEVIFQQVNAERKFWQQKGELAKVTNEQLLDATATYVDLLTARTGEMIASELEQYEQELLDYAERQAKVDPGATVQVVAIKGTLTGHRQAHVRTRQQGDAASSKLCYLLGMGSCIQLVPADRFLAPLDLVDANIPCCDLVTRAWSSGPGIKELEGLLGTIQDGMARSQGWVAKMPVFEVKMLEGAFGAGPGDDMTWDNRWDLGLQARWNLTDLLSGKEKLRAAQSRLHQVELTYQDLKNKLAMGVQEAQDSITSGREQITLAEKQVELAREAYRISWQRVRANVQNATASEVLQAIRGVEAAQLNKLQVVREFDKAQLRLLLLLGPVSGASR